MITYENKKVKIFLKNGMALEGHVISWGTQEVLLKSDEEESSDCTLIVYDPRENIIMTKVYEEPKPLTVEEQDALKEEVKSDFDSGGYTYSDPAPPTPVPQKNIESLKNRGVDKSHIDKLELENERIRKAEDEKKDDTSTHHEVHVENIENLVELQKAKAKAERNQIAQKLKSFLPNPGQSNIGKYVPPYSKK